MDFLFLKEFLLLLVMLSVTYLKKDGDKVSKGKKIGEVKGNTQKVLMGERIGLNLLQRMSGIATTTYQNMLKKLNILMLK